MNSPWCDSWNSHGICDVKDLQMSSNLGVFILAAQVPITYCLNRKAGPAIDSSGYLGLDILLHIPP